MEITREKVSIAREGGGITRTIARIDRNAPDLDSLFAEDDNPLDQLTDAGGVQENADQEMSAVEREIEENRAAYAEHFRVAADPEFFLCLCFQSHDQKDEFLNAIKWPVDEQGDKYLNGLEFARLFNIPVKVIQLEPRKVRTGAEKYRKTPVIGE
jgi:hypothetical protein